MDYLWIGMNKIPPSKSMIPINREDYMKDMNLYGTKLSSQVAADTPRQQIQICDTKKSFCIQIKHGIILEEILHKLITKKNIVYEVLALSTQTAFAAPMRALSMYLLQKDTYLAECEERKTLKVLITIDENGKKVRVSCEKELNMVKYKKDGGIKRLHNVQILIEYDSDEPFVLVHLKKC